MNYPAAELRGIKYSSQQVVQKWELGPVDFLILLALFLNVGADYIFIRIRTNRVDIISGSPDVATPKHFLDFRIATVYLFCGYALDYLNHLARCHRRDALYEKMHVVLIHTNLHKVHFVPFPDSKAGFFQGLLHFLCKHLPPILGRTNDVIKEQILIMPL